MTLALQLTHEGYLVLPHWVGGVVTGVLVGWVRWRFPALLRRLNETRLGRLYTERR